MAKKKKKKSFGTKNTYSRNDTVPMSFYHEEDNTFEEDDIFEEDNAFEEDDIFEEDNAFEEDDIFEEDNAFEEDDIFEEDNAFEEDDIFEEDNAFEEDDEDEGLHETILTVLNDNCLNKVDLLTKNCTKSTLAEQIATDIPPYQLGSKKTVAIHHLVDCIIDSNQLVTITGGIAFAYQKDLGCYQKIISLESFVVRLLSISGHYIRLSNKEIKDMCEQIRWYPFCAREHDAFNNNPQFINMGNGVLGGYEEKSVNKILL